MCSLVENILKAETGKEIPTCFRITASGVFLPQLKGTLSYRISQHKAYFKIVFFATWKTPALRKGRHRSRERNKHWDFSKKRWLQKHYFYLLLFQQPSKKYKDFIKVGLLSSNILEVLKLKLNRNRPHTWLWDSDSQYWEDSFICGDLLFISLDTIQCYF